MKKKLLIVTFLALLSACGGTNNSSSSDNIVSSEDGISSEIQSSESISTEIPTNIEDFTFEKTDLGIPAINEDGGITITKYTCKKNSTLNVVIPETYQPSGSTKVYNITRIAEKAFLFAGGIETITLSKNIKKSASNAFAGCSTLKAIYVDENNEYYSSRNDLLYTKDGKTLVSGPNGKEEVLIDSQTETISSSAFSNNRTTTFIFEEGVKTIESRAFEKTKKAESITLPNSVQTLGEYVFANSDVKELHLGTGISTIPAYAIYQCSSLNSLRVPGNVKNIKYSGIGDNQHLTTLILEEGVETIEDYAISFNANLENLTLPTSLRTIGKCGFISSPSLINVVIPEGVETIGEGAFSHSTALQTLYISSTVNEIGQGIVQYCTDFREFTLSEENEYFVLDDSSLYTKDKTRLIAVPQFYGELGYHTFVVPSTVEYVDNFAFNYSIRITKVVLPASIKVLGVGTFAGSAVKELEFLGTVEEWENIIKTAIFEEVETDWNLLSSITEVVCSNGTVTLTQEEVA